MKMNAASAFFFSTADPKLICHTPNHIDVEQTLRFGACVVRNLTCHVFKKQGSHMMKRFIVEKLVQRLAARQKVANGMK